MKEAGERLLGRRREEVLGKTWHEAFPHAVGNPVDRMYQRVMRTREAETMEYDYAHYGRLFEISAAPVTSGGIAVYFRDISDRARLYRSLQESEQRFRTVVETQSEMVCRFRLDGTLLFVNSAYARALGATPEAIVGRNFWDLIPDKERVSVRRRLERLTAQAPEVRIENRFETAAGTRWTLWINRALGVDAEGRVLEAQSTGIDITERKRAEEALRAADRHKDEFIATLAHELRNPLAPIRNGLHLMRVASGKPELLEQARGMMERQFAHLVRLVDDLLEVSRITRGKIELRREQVDVSTVIRSAIEASRPLIEAARHVLMVELPDDPVMLDADPVRIAQVLSNLLNNAAKYTSEGGSIWLRVYREEQYAVIAVRDSGAGIPPDALPGIFDLFAQVERTYDRAQGGLGIGLTLVRSLVRMHGGTVEARSQGVGLGSEFIVRLPLGARQPAPARAIGERPPPLTVMRTRILVVDDSRDAADSLELLLRYLGAEVRTAYDGPTGLAALETFKPNVVLLDIGLPGMDGFEVARRIRRSETGENVVLIALSGWGREEDRRRSRDAGIDHHFIKPVDPETQEQLLASLPQRAAAHTPG